VESKARCKVWAPTPVNMSKSPSGSPVYHYLAFAGQDAMVDIRNSTSFQTALQSIAQASGSGTELFNGKLVDWQGVYLWEHTVVNPDADDVLGSPIAPYGLLGTAITAGTTAIDITFGRPWPTPTCIARFFPGYDWSLGRGSDRRSRYHLLLPVDRQSAQRRPRTPARLASTATPAPATTATRSPSAATGNAARAQVADLAPRSRAAHHDPRQRRVG
jgi:hypothetical protein